MEARASRAELKLLLDEMISGAGAMERAVVWLADGRAWGPPELEPPRAAGHKLARG